MWIRIVGSLLLAMGLMTSITATATPAVDQFKNSWVAHALALQRDIDVNAPLSQATFIGTHNSENAISYQIPFLRYIDPNQILSIHDQLEMGVRSIEYDVHWYTDSHFKKEILLCHALPNHVGCSMFDRPVIEGLSELRDWLQKNPGEVVVLYFDRGVALDGHEPRLTSYLQTYLGSYIYKPAVLRKTPRAVPACLSVPATLRKADVLKAGKQLIIVTKGCDGPNPRYAEQDTYRLDWNDYVFAGVGNVSGHPFTIMDSTIGDDFTAYPDCSKSTVFVDDPQHTSVWRIFEDRTLLAKVIGHPRKILVDEVHTMVNCGINWQTFDMLSANDERLAAAIWSWAPNYPLAGNGDCALYKDGGAIENARCEMNAAGFACQDEVSGEFKAVLGAGQWNEGEGVCQRVAGPGWHFKTPINGNQMYLLKQSVSTAQLPAIWLNYHRDASEKWQAN